MASKATVTVTTVPAAGVIATFTIMNDEGVTFTMTQIAPDQNTAIDQLVNAVNQDAADIVAAATALKV
jgi:hypothetical protein